MNCLCPKLAALVFIDNEIKEIDRLLLLNDEYVYSLKSRKRDLESLDEILSPKKSNTRTGVE